MRILHVAETARGGVGSYLEEIAPLQARRYGGDSVRVLMPEDDARLFPGLQGARVCGFAQGNGSRAARSWRMLRRAYAECRAWSPDVVHLHSTGAGLARPLLRLTAAGARIVYCAHGWAFDRDVPPATRRTIAIAERALAAFCHAVVCISSNDHQRALDIGIAPQRCRLVLNGIADLEPATQPSTSRLWPAGCLRILFVGRLDRQKGVDLLYRAMQRLGPEAYAVVVGQSVVGGSADPAPPDNVHVTGWLPRAEIDALHRSAQVFVAPSRWEGLPLAALEAMRASLPVVASRVGGLQELVADGWSGRLVEAGDVDQLTAALRGADPAALARMGLHGRERFLQRFGVQRVVQELDGVYRDILDRGRAKRPLAIGG